MKLIKKIIKYFFLLLYYGIAYNLPNYSFPGGRFYNWFRVFCLKRILPIGNNCRIMRKVYIGDGDRILIGNGNKINEGVRLCNVNIGDFVMIARNHTFIGAQHNYKKTDIPMSLQGYEWGPPTKIDNDVWIGINVIIMPGVHVQEGCIIGAGAVLTHNTEKFSIYAGNPAKIIKRRN
jgi:maltose O-acetyltransferase